MLPFYLALSLAGQTAAQSAVATVRNAFALTPDQTEHGDLDDLLHSFDKRIDFTENRGQFASPVLFRADFPLGQAVATRSGMVISTYDPASVKARGDEGERIEKAMQDGKPFQRLHTGLKGHSWSMDFVGRSADMRISGRQPHGDAHNYFLGKGRSDVAGVSSYQEVWYEGVYDKIDVRYYPAADGNLEYDVICRPGSDPRKVAISMKGIERMSLGAKGELLLHTSVGDVQLPAPVVYQRINGRQRAVTAAYAITNGNELRFRLGDYDRSEPLVIDPIALRWATWVNTASTGDNHGHCIWVDPSDGAIYVVARVVGTTDQITPGAFDVSANGELEMVVGKYLEPNTVGGSGTRVWQTYIGGNGDDNPYAMEQGPDGHLYITGYTSSTNYPLLSGSAFSGTSIDQRAQTSNNIFITKINTAGNSIKSAVVGGNGDDGSFDIRIDATGNVLVCGNTRSANLATLYAGSGASNTNNGDVDVVVFQLNSDLSAVNWMKNYGGSGLDQATIMLQDNATGDIFVGGFTASTNFPTTSPRQATRGGTQAGFLQRLTSAGATTWSSYFQAGSGLSASILCMEFNTTRDQIYFGGITTGLAASNISAGSFDTSHNGSNDLFVCQMGIDQTFLKGTYLGGGNNEVNMMGLNTDQNNDVYVFGYTNSTNFPTTSSPNTALQTSNQGSNDKTFTKLRSDLGALLFSTYYGGSQDDYDPVGERGIKFSNCRIYTIVTSRSNNLPLTLGALNTARSSSTSIYEPGLVVWANPPDLLGNSIIGNQSVCAGAVPGDIMGSVPAYVLPTIRRNTTNSTYPTLGSAASYQWQISTDSVNWNNIPSATAQNLSGAMIGVVNAKTYVRRIIGGDACILAGAADQVVTVKLISVSATVDNVSCFGLSDGSLTAQCDGVAPFTYAWSNGQSTQTATGLLPGSYSVTVTDGNGCTAEGTFTVTQPTLLTAGTQTGLASCGNPNGSATVTPSGGTPGYTYLWNEGSTTQGINGLAGGNYSVTVTDANGCTAPAQANVPATQPPQASAGADRTITCTTGNAVLLQGSSSTPGVNFSWTASNGGHIASGANTATPTVDAAGTYTLTVTEIQSGCSSTDVALVTVNTTAPNANAGNDKILTCATTSVTLNGASSTAGATFAWSGPGGYTSTDAQPTVSVAGTYTLVVTGANGCTSQASAEVTLDNAVPGAQAQGGLLTCSITSVMLTGSGNGSFAWSGPGGFASTEQNPVVSVAGTYTLVVTGANGCTSQASAEVTLDNAVPGAQAQGGVITCSITSVMLTGSGNGSFAWSGPGGFSSTEQNPVVSVAGTYTLVATGANGCTSQASAEVTLDNTVPGAQAQGGVLTCSITSVMLTGSGNGSFAWSGPGGFASTEQNPVVSVAGTYTLVVTGANGCTSQASAEVTLDNTVPGAQAQGGVITCSITSVMLTGSGNGSFAWSGPGGFASTEQNPVVSVAGTYTLVVTGANGCTSQASAEVTLDNAVPGAQAQGGVITCSITSVMLTGSGNGSFAWSGPGGFSSTEQNPVVSVAGTYTLVVTGANGCTSQASAEVTLDNTVPGAQAQDGVITCSITSVMLTGGGNGSFAWSGPGGFSSTEQNPVVSVAGTYTLVVTGANGCTSQASAEVTLDNAVPGAQTQGGVITCSITSVMLTGSGNGSFAWSGPGGFSSTEQNPVVSVAGTYTLVVTGANGCTSQASAEVTLDNAVPGAQAQGGVLTCSITSVMLTGSGNGSFAWSGPGGFASTEQNPVVSVAGTYTLVVTGANGCTSQASAEVILNNAIPDVSTHAYELTCDLSSTLVVGSSNTPGVTYAWSGPYGFSSTEQSPQVSEFGTYTLLVTAPNGCMNTAEAVVTGPTSVSNHVFPIDTLTCTRQTVQIRVGSLTPGATFTWTGPNGYTNTGTSPFVTEPGIYTVVGTTTRVGCISTKQVEVIQNITPPGAQASGGQITCATTSVTLIGVGDGSFAWTGPNGFSSAAQSPVVGMAGTYTLTVTGANGCISEATAEVTMDSDVPGAQAQGGVFTCSNPSVMLMGGGNGSFAWSGPNGFASIEQNPLVGVAGTYTLVVTGANGCSSQATTEVSGDTTRPGASAQGGVLDCNHVQVSLDGSSPTPNVTFAWSGPNGFASTEQNPVVSVAGTYTLVVMGANGCTSQAVAEVELDADRPVVSATGGSINCNLPDVQLHSSSSGVGVSFAWTGPNGFTSTEQAPIVNGVGTYVVTATAANGCTGTAEAIVANPDGWSTSVFALGDTLTCNAPIGQLTGASITPNVSYAWTGPNGFTSSEQHPAVSIPGSYTLTTFTSTPGCTNSKTVEVVDDRTPPQADAQGGALTCTATSVMLTGSGNGSFAWSGPNGFTSTEQNPVVSAAGTYTLVVTGANGCSSEASAEVTMDSNLPGAQAQGGVLTCNITSVMLTGGGNGSFAWSGPNGFTSIEQNPMVSAAGTYTLVVTGANGCSSEASAEVTMDSNLPGAQAQGGVLTCNITSVMLTGGGNGSFAWSGPNGFASIEQNPMVSAAGTYTLVVTGANGCSSEASAEVTMDSNLPGAQAQGGVLTCNITSVMLTGGGNGSFAWSGPNGFASIEQNPMVSVAGTYTLVVTGANGCASQASAEVTMDSNLPGAQAQGGVLTCNTTSVMLSGSGNGSFAWSGPNGFASIEQNPLVGVAGTYTLVVTGANGCTSQASAEVTMDSNLPGAQAQGGVLTCNITSVMLTGGGNGSFAWSGPNGFTSTEQNPVVSAAGTYTLVVTGANGCTSQASAEVTMDSNLPGAQAQGGVLTCNITSVMLIGGGNGSFAWSGPNGFTSTEQNPVVSAAGTYTLVVTGANGCTSEATANVSGDTTRPEASAQGGVLDCNHMPLVLDGSSPTANVTFAWSGPNGFVSNDEDPAVYLPGTYVLVVTSGNGCSAEASATVILDATHPDISSAGGTLDCAHPTVALNGASASPNVSYLWSNMGTFSSTEASPVVAEPGLYFLLVTGENGCSSFDTVEVVLDLATPNVSADGGEIACDDLDGIALNGGSATDGASFSWTSANGFQSSIEDPTVTMAGFYTLTVMGPNGCIAEAVATVTQAICDECKTPIIIACAPDRVLECGASLDPKDIGEPEVRKNKKCPEVVFSTYSDQYTGTCPIVVVRTWTIGDAEGNFGSCKQLITLEDHTAPVLLNVPRDLTVECGHVPHAPTGIWAEDGCKKGLIPVTYDEQIVSGPCAGSYLIKRIWTAKDDCGNIAAAGQTITVVDTQGPVLTCMPEDVTVSCDAIPSPVACKGLDACAGEVDVVVDDQSTGTDCSEGFIIKRTYSAKDECGNTTTVVQTITVQGDVHTGVGDIASTDGSTITVWPNPFRDACSIRFEAGDAGRAVLSIVDAQGREVARPFNADVAKGRSYTVRFDRTDKAAGVYLYRLSIGDERIQGRLVVE